MSTRRREADHDDLPDAGAGGGSARGRSADQAGGDPTRTGHWRPLRLLLDAMDADIAQLYAQRGVDAIRPRFVLPLLRLRHQGPMTIRELATSLEVTHSAASQTVAAMRREALVTTIRGEDARSRLVALTDRAHALMPLLEAEWRATEKAVIELEDELPYPLTQVVRDIEQALEQRPFRDRIAAHLDDHLDAHLDAHLDDHLDDRGGDESRP